jgi:Lrp/AsnC family leucine-responsive transcriptional regulator
MDDIDRRILELLQNDGRMTMKDLGGQIGLTSPATIERVKKMEESGIIRGYAAVVDVQKVGPSLRAFFLVNCNCSCRQFAEFAALHEQIISCHRISGKYCYLTETVVSGIAELEELQEQLLELGSVETIIVLSSPFDNKSVRFQNANLLKVVGNV